MEQIFLQYLQYIFTTVESDMNGFMHWYMWFIIPAWLYFIFLILKYMILLMPVWFPTLCIGNMFKNIFGRETIYITKNKKRKTTKNNEI